MAELKFDQNMLSSEPELCLHTLVLIKHRGVGDNYDNNDDDNGNPIKFSSLNMVFKALNNVGSIKLFSPIHCLSTHMSILVQLNYSKSPNAHIPLYLSLCLSFSSLLPLPNLSWTCLFFKS